MPKTLAVLADLKKDPMGVLRAANGCTVVILDRNTPAFYAVPPERYEAMLEIIDDARLAELVRLRQGEPAVRVDIEELIAGN